MAIINTSLKKTVLHAYHIVDPSPWPVVVSFSAFFTVFGLVLHRHGFLGFKLFALGFLTLLGNVTLWWRDVVREGTFEGQHTTAVQNGLRFGRILFIVSEIRLFFAFFWAYFHASLNPTPSIGSVWPPRGIEARNPWLIPLLNTAILLTSGASLTWSHAALLGGFRQEARTSLVITLVLATLFTAFQGYEYLNAPFTIADGVYGSTFYRLTGLHGFHVLVGTFFLAVSLYRRARHHYTVSTHVGFECAAWYWHFVDVVWLFLFLAVYVWGDVYHGELCITGNKCSSYLQLKHLIFYLKYLYKSMLSLLSSLVGNFVRASQTYVVPYFWSLVDALYAVLKPYFSVFNSYLQVVKDYRAPRVVRYKVPILCATWLGYGAAIWLILFSLIKYLSTFDPVSLSVLVDEFLNRHFHKGPPTQTRSPRRISPGISDPSRFHNHWINRELMRESTRVLESARSVQLAALTDHSLYDQVGKMKVVERK